MRSHVAFASTAKTTRTGDRRIRYENPVWRHIDMARSAFAFSAPADAPASFPEERGRDVVPRAILDKPPSAELRPDQTDQDSLPPYEELDGILEPLIEEHLGVAEIVARGYEQPTVERVVRLVGANEFKRKQAAPGIKVTDRAFGMGWRMPIATVPRARRRPD